MESILQSLQNLRTTYIDLILIHWPGVKGLQLNSPINQTRRQETWHVLEEAFEKGLVKLIGVSNYNIRQLNELFEYARIKPQWLQVYILDSFELNL